MQHEYCRLYHNHAQGFMPHEFSMYNYKASCHTSTVENAITMYKASCHTSTVSYTMTMYKASCHTSTPCTRLHVTPVLHVPGFMPHQYCNNNNVLFCMLFLQIVHYKARNQNTVKINFCILPWFVWGFILYRSSRIHHDCILNLGGLLHLVVTVCCRWYLLQAGFLRLRGWQSDMVWNRQVDWWDLNFASV